MTNVMSFELGPKTIKVLKQENVSSTRFTKYVVTNDGNTVMTAFHFKAVSDYFNMLVQEILEVKNV